MILQSFQICLIYSDFDIIFEILKRAIKIIKGSYLIEDFHLLINLLRNYEQVSSFRLFKYVILMKIIILHSLPHSKKLESLRISLLFSFSESYLILKYGDALDKAGQQLNLCLDLKPISEAVWYTLSFSHLSIYSYNKLQSEVVLFSHTILYKQTFTQINHSLF